MAGFVEIFWVNFTKNQLLLQWSDQHLYIVPFFNRDNHLLFQQQYTLKKWANGKAFNIIATALVPSFWQHRALV